MNHKKLIVAAVAVAILGVLIAGCETLKTSRPIIPIKEYERMITGRVDANYIGNKACLSACHVHDRLRTDFEASTMGAQMSAKSGMPVVDCESCHGPGSLAVEGITEEKVKKDAEQGIQTKCNYETLIDIRGIPGPAQSLICLKCHTANATMNLHNYNTTTHGVNDVSCSDCHRIHAGPDLKVRPRETFKMCYKCHEERRSEFALPHHHPVPEQKITCTDCHDPHGTVSERLLRKFTIKETCAQCHAAQAAPVTFAHADTMENCTVCHGPHGSIGQKLLKVDQPFLCLQCHAGHAVRGAGGPSSLQAKGAFYTRCTDCHSMIHGSDIPSPSGRGRFIQ